MSHESNEQQRRLAEEMLRGMFEASLGPQVERYQRAKVHNVIPFDFFSAASTECRDMYVAGNFYGCITLCQSVAEGLSKFLAEKNELRFRGGLDACVRRLKGNGVISLMAARAFHCIHGEDRNDFHHLNKEIEQDYRELDKRALECLDGLRAVESEVFAYDIVNDGVIRPKHPQYWPRTEERALSVCVRFA